MTLPRLSFRKQRRRFPGFVYYEAEPFSGSPFQRSHGFFPYLIAFFRGLFRNRVRILSGLISFSLLFNQVLFAHLPQKNVWDERRQVLQRAQQVNTPPLQSNTLLAQLAAFPSSWPQPNALKTGVVAGSLPFGMNPVRGGSGDVSALISLLSMDGIVKDVHIAKPMASLKTAPIMIHIQDIHGQMEAQVNIASLLRKISETHPDALIGLEGSAGLIDLTPFRGPDPAMNSEVGAFFFNTGLIAGPEYAALTSSHLPSFLGVEDRELYLKNVEAVKESLVAKSALMEKINQQSEGFEREKLRVFSGVLAQFDQKSRAYESGDLSLGEYVSFLLRAKSQPPLPLSHPLVQFTHLWAMEKSLNVASAERERNDFLKILVSRLPRETLESLLAETTAVKSGMRTLADYHRHLEAMAHDARVNWASFPHFKNYITYVLLADTLKPDVFLKTLRSFEQTVWADLCQTSEQRELHQRDRQLVLVGKLVQLNLTTEEWNEYKKATGDWRPATDNNNSSSKLPVASRSLAPFESFYEIALARNQAMAENMSRSTSPLSVLVAGGFHTDGLTRLLADKHVTVITVTPKLVSVKAGSGNEYLSVFSQGRTPIEQLFESPKITLARTLGIQPITADGQARHAILLSVGPRLRALFSKLSSGRELVQEQVKTPRLHTIVASISEIPPSGSDLLNGRGVYFFAAVRGSLERPWILETLQYQSVLALGVVIQNPLIILAGLLISVIVFPLGHGKQDQHLKGMNYVNRLWDRTVWSVLFTAAYVVGFVGLVDLGVSQKGAAFLALLAPTILHYLNHRAVQFPSSLAERLLLRVFKLPRVLMSKKDKKKSPKNSKQPPEQLFKQPPDLNLRQTLDKMYGRDQNPPRPPLIKGLSEPTGPVGDAVAPEPPSTGSLPSSNKMKIIEELSAAVQQWRQSPDYLSEDVKSDPVSERLSKLFTVDYEMMSALIEREKGLLEDVYVGIFNRANFTEAEWRTRAYRDVYSAFTVAVEWADEAINLQFLFASLIYLNTLFKRMSRDQRLSNAMDQGVEKAIKGFPYDMMKQALTHWKNNSSDESGEQRDEEITKTWTAFNTLTNRFRVEMMIGGENIPKEYKETINSLSGKIFREIIDGIEQAYRNAALTSDEWTIRAAKDLYDFSVPPVRRDPSPWVVQLFYELAINLREREDPDLALQLRKAVIESYYRHVSVRLVDMITEWLAQSPDEPSSKEFKNAWVNFSIWRYEYLIADLKHQFPDADTQESLRQLIDNQIVAAFSNDVIGVSRLEARVSEDLRYALEFDDPDYVRLITRFYVELADRLGEAHAEKRQAIQKGLTDGWFTYCRRTASERLANRQQLLTELSSPSDPTFVDLLKDLHQKGAMRGLNLDVMEEALAQALVDLNLPRNIMALSYTLDFTETAKGFFIEDNPLAIPLALHTKTIYQKVVEKVDADTARAIRIAQEECRDIILSYRRRLSKWKETLPLNEAGEVPQFSLIFLTYPLLILLDDAPPPEELAPELAQVIIEADLTPKELGARAARDLSTALEGWFKRSSSSSSEPSSWRPKKMDPGVELISRALFDVARHYGTTDSEHAKVLIEGMGASLDIFMTSHKLSAEQIEPFLIHIAFFGMEFVEFGRADFALHCFENLQKSARLESYGPDAYEAGAEITAALAIKDGVPTDHNIKQLEDLAFIKWARLTSGVHHVGEWRIFIDLIIYLSGWLFMARMNKSALDYVRTALAFISKYPLIRKAIPDDRKTILEGFEAANALYFVKDPSELPGLIQKMKEVLALLAVQDPSNTKARFIIEDALCDATIDACVLGDRRYYDEAMALVKQKFADSENKRDQIMFENWIRHNTEEAKRKAGLTEEADQLRRDMVAAINVDNYRQDGLLRPNDLPWVLACAFHKLWFDRIDEGIEILDYLGQKLGEAGLQTEWDEQTLKEGQQLVSTHLTGFLLKRGSSDDMARAQAAMREAWSLPMLNVRRIYALARVVRENYDPQGFLKVADHLVSQIKRADRANLSYFGGMIRFLRVLEPTGLNATEENWRKNKALKDVWKYIDATLGAESEQTDPTPWPGLPAFRAGFIAQRDALMAEVERSITSSPRGHENFPRWLESFNGGLRMTTQVLATLCATMHQSEEAVESLGLIYKWLTGQKGALPYFYQGLNYKIKIPAGLYYEEKAMVELPFRANNVSLAIAMGRDIFHSGGSAQFREKTTALARYLGALTRFGFIEVKSRKEYVDLANKTLQFLDNLDLPDYASYRLYIKSVLLQELGRLKQARDLAQETSESIELALSETVTFNSLLLFLCISEFFIPGTSLSERAERVRSHLARNRELNASQKSMNVIWRLNADLLSPSPLMPVSYEDIGRTILSMVETATESEFLSYVDNGLPLLVVETAYLIGEESSVTKDLVGLLDTLEEWVGGESGDNIQAARPYYQALISDPKAFLSWMDSAYLAKMAPWLQHQLRMEMAFLANDQTLAAEELVLMFGEMPHFPDQRAVFEFGVGSLSPVPYRAFFGVAHELLAHFNAAFWEKKPDELTRFLMMCAALGDAQVVFLFDDLVRNNSFKLKALLQGPEGLIAQMEPMLTSGEWLDRILRLDVNDVAQIEAMKTRAFPHMNEEDRNRVDALLQERKAIDERKAVIQTALTSARAALDTLRFDEAMAHLNSIPRPEWTADFDPLVTRVNQMREAWDYYQEGSDDYDDLAIETANKAKNGKPGASENLAARIATMRELEKGISERKVGPETVRQKAATLVIDGLGDARLNKLVRAIDRQCELAQSTYRQALTKLEVYDRLLNEIHHSRVNRGHRTSRPDQLEQLELLWNDVVETMRTALRYNGESPEINHALISIAEQYIQAGRADLENDRFGPANGRFAQAQDLAQVVFTTSLDSGQKARAKQIRDVARPLEIYKDLLTHFRILKTKIEADLSRVNRNRIQGPFSASDKKGITLHFKVGDYDSEKNRFTLNTVWLQKDDEPAREKKPADRGRSPRPNSPPAVLQMWKADNGNLDEPMADAPSSYIFTWVVQGKGPHEKSYINIGMAFLGKDKEGRLVFEIDKKNGEQLQKVKTLQGRLQFVDDYSTLGQISALEPLVSRLHRALFETPQKPSKESKANLTQGEPVSTGMAIVDRLLGLDLSPRTIQGADLSFFNEKLANDPNQRTMIQDALHPDMDAMLVWGPPGSGKTVSLEEMCVQMIKPRSAESPGKVVVVVSQSNYGLDNVGKKLKADNVQFVRAAAKEVNVDDELKEIHAQRMALLMGLIETHRKTGRGFIYLATNNGLVFDRRLYALLTMHLEGRPLSEIRAQYEYWQKIQNGTGGKKVERDPFEQQQWPKMRPTVIQEEGSMADVAETLIPIMQLNPNRYELIGDHMQLPAHGLGESDIRLIEKEVKEGHFKPSLGSFTQIFSHEAILNQRISLFERSFLYAEKWGGIPTYILNVVRRSHWLIATLINRLFYEGLLTHKDAFENPDPNTWEPIDEDTLLIVDVDKNGALDREEQGGSDPLMQKLDDGKSWRNFLEAGEAVRLVTYCLNRGFEPSQIYVLSPYKAQNALIHDLLWMVGVLNDFADNKEVSSDELSQVVSIGKNLLCSRALHERKINIDTKEILRLLSQLQHRPQEIRHPAAFVRDLLSELSPLTSLEFEGRRKISRDDVKKVRNGDEEEDRDIGKLVPKTIDSIQGHENDVVIVSFTRSNPGKNIGFLKLVTGLKRLNVANSRPRLKLALVGSFSTLTGSRVYQDLLDIAEEEVGVYNQRQRELGSQGSVVHWKIRDEAPHKVSDIIPHRRPPESLRQAWAISLGNAERNDRFDRVVAPVAETILFLVLVGVGLARHDGVLVLIGLGINSVVIPLLHVLPGWISGRPDRSLIDEMTFFGRMSVLYAISFFFLSLVISPWISALAAFLVPWFFHWTRNSPADAALPSVSRKHVGERIVSEQPSLIVELSTRYDIPKMRHAIIQIDTVLDDDHERSALVVDHLINRIRMMRDVPASDRSDVLLLRDASQIQLVLEKLREQMKNRLSEFSARDIQLYMSRSMVMVDSEELEPEAVIRKANALRGFPFHNNIHWSIFTADAKAWKLPENPSDAESRSWTLYQLLSDLKAVPVIESLIDSLKGRRAADQAA